jgi:signal transduction histidine kinase
MATPGDASHHGGMPSVFTIPPERLRGLGWAPLLPCVMLIGMAFWGIRLWTVIAVAAAAVVAVLYPVLAADLVPLVLTGFGLYSLVLIHRTSTFPPGSGSTRGYPLHVLLFGTGTAHAVDLAAGLAMLAFAAWLAPRTIGTHAVLAERNKELGNRVRRLTTTRVEAVDTAAAELRRVERDLHDGAQARLIALGISLRATERLIRTDPDIAVALVAQARENSAKALAELRALVAGIHPPVLAERGLGDALRALALDYPVATTADVDLPGPLSEPVEAAAYFAVAEALANAAKHADAHSVHIRAAHSAGALRIEVTDDGVGGADPERGSGLRGVERRLATFDGVLAISSPLGGPTIIVIEVPCALSSQKTSSC